MVPGSVGRASAHCSTAVGAGRGEHCAPCSFYHPRGARNGGCSLLLFFLLAFRCAAPLCRLGGSHPRTWIDCGRPHGGTGWRRRGADWHLSDEECMPLTVCGVQLNFSVRKNAQSFETSRLIHSIAVSSPHSEAYLKGRYPFTIRLLRQCQATSSRW